jgi:thioredoxin reductase (NADPH)
MTQSKQTEKEQKTKVLIIGSGPAGYSAAIYAARACLEPIVITGMQKGGQLMITTDVENYPGFVEPIPGPKLMEMMEKQSLRVGAKIIEDTVTEVDFSKRPFHVKTDFGQVYKAESIIIATGAVAKWLGLESEEKFKGFGVSACATCDGFFYRGKHVIVVGGGNTAVEEALYLTNHAKKVTLIHRRDQLKAEQIMQQRLFNNSKIEIIWDTALEEVLGTTSPKTVTGVKLKNLKTKKTSNIEIDGVFIAIGYKPNTNLFANKLKTNSIGYIITEPDSTITNVPGVFAAGDVQDSVFRQAVTSAGTGCMAALEAERFLAQDESKKT